MKHSKVGLEHPNFGLLNNFNSKKGDNRHKISNKTKPMNKYYLLVDYQNK